MADLHAILPRPTAASAPFWESCDREALILPLCEDCGHVFFYPRIHCPLCASRKLGWKRASGHGTVFSFSHVAVSFYGAEWESQLPYTVVLVDLAEGPRMASRLIGEDREAVRSGDPVTVTFPQIEGRRLPFFIRDTNTEAGPQKGGHP